jgi:hypothetical protein
MEPNTHKWRRGDFVIEEYATKDACNLMQVLGYDTFGQLTTQFVRQQHWKKVPWHTVLPRCAYDPRLFGIETAGIVPRTVATCPTCNRTLFLEVDEWEDETGAPTEGGCKPQCMKLHPDAIETQMPYVYWLPLEVKVYRWAVDHVRVLWVEGKGSELVTPEEYAQRRDAVALADWEAWAKGATV